MTKLLSMILVLGGVFGAGLAILMGLQYLPVSLLSAGQYLVLFSGLFIWSAWQGINLWREKPIGIKWAKILFAAQIPAFTFGGFGYEFYTLFNGALIFGEVSNPISINLGSALSLFYLGAEEPNFFGINIIAIASLAYLLVAHKPNKPSQQDASEAGASA